MKLHTPDIQLSSNFFTLHNLTHRKQKNISHLIYKNNSVSLSSINDHISFRQDEDKKDYRNVQRITELPKFEDWLGVKKQSIYIRPL